MVCLVFRLGGCSEDIACGRSSSCRVPKGKGQVVPEPWSCKVHSQVGCEQALLPQLITLRTGSRDTSSCKLLKFTAIMSQPRFPFKSRLAETLHCFLDMLLKDLFLLYVVTVGKCEFGSLELLWYFKLSHN